MKKALLLTCAWALAVSAALAGEPAEKKVPEIGKIDPADLTQAARGALRKAMDYLRKRAAADEGGWVAPPARHRKVVDYKQVTRRYRKGVYHQPVYEYEDYWAYERAAGADSLSSKKLKKVKRRRIKRQIGTKPIPHLVYDPKGPITKNVRQAIYGPGGPDSWYVGRLGYNGLALYAMRKAGVPADDEVVAKLAENLADFSDKYGSPDTTWDLACITAGFAMMPDAHYQRKAKEQASKLLDGQITTGKGAGLWGPVSINTKLLISALKYEHVLGKIRDRAKEALDKLNSVSAQKRFDKAEETLLDLQKVITRQISMTSPALAKIDWRIYLKSDDDEHIYLTGLADYIYTQASTDVENTAMALWALRVAAEHGVLPAQTLRPTVKGRSLAPARKAVVVLSRAARALAGAQKKDGGWDEMNRHQAVTHFNGMNALPGVPMRTLSFPPLESKTTFMSTWQGYSAFLSAGHAIGIRRLLAKLSPRAVLADARARKLAEALIDGTAKEELLGSRVPPFDCGLFLAGVSRQFQGMREDRRDLWLRFTYKLIETQNNDGAWGPKYPRTYLLPTSLRARMDCKAMQKTPESPPRGKPHTLMGWAKPGVPGMKYHCYGQRSPLFRGKRVYHASGYAVDGYLHATVSAMVFLADGVRPPVAGECVWSDKAGAENLLPGAMAKLRKTSSVSLTYAALGRELPADDLLTLPVLVLRGTGEFAPADAAKESLKAFIANGGVVVAAAANGVGGNAFLQKALEVLMPLVEGGDAKDIGGDKDLLGETAGKGSINAITTAKGTPAVIFLPVTTSRRPIKGAVTESQAGAIVAELLLRRAPADVVKEDYPVALDDDPEPDGAGEPEAGGEDGEAKPEEAEAE
jgi:hypothetical protein